jgi:putative transcriptional regulator
MEDLMSADIKILAGLEEAIAHARGDKIGIERSVQVPDMFDVQALRKSLDLTQAEFALMFGFSIDTVRNWEQAKRVPHASARALLKIIETEPEAVKRALAVG